MSDAPLQIPRRSPPGFARRPGEPPARQAPAPPSDAGEPVAGDERADTAPATSARPKPRKRAAAAAPARARRQEPEPATTIARDAGGVAYGGTGSVQFNVRLLTPLHERYARLVRRLADEGFKTTSTELVHALLHEGPEDPAAARELVRRWRRVRAEV